MLDIKYFAQVRSVALTQIFATIPKRYAKDFAAQTYKTNMERFATQCIVLVVMDAIYLMIGLFFMGNYNNFPMLNIIVVSFKIILMLAGYFYFKVISKIPYEEVNFYKKNMDFIYPMIHFILELLLFFTSSQSLSSLVRMTAVPFICGSIPIIKQSKSIIMMLIIFGCSMSYLPFSHYYPPVNPLMVMLNIWLVVFVCANLLSFIVYSAQVENFCLSKLESEAREKVEEISMIDELTGINNRRMIMTYLEREWQKELAEHETLSVIIFDIDHFKQLNDTYGHKKGDDCLVLIANTASEIAKWSDYEMARYGGEEFLIIAFDKEHMESVRLAEEIRMAIDNLAIPNENSSVKETVTASFGVSTQKIASAQHYGRILEWADECLYFAKNAGRNRVAHREDQRSQYRVYNETDQGNTVTTANYPIKDSYGAGSIHSVIEDFNVDYAFIYYKQKGLVKFSKPIVEYLGLPDQIHTPIIDNVSKVIHIPNRDLEIIREKIDGAISRKAPFFAADFGVERDDGNFVKISINAKCIYSSEDELEVIYGTMIH